MDGVDQGRDAVFMDLARVGVQIEIAQPTLLRQGIVSGLYPCADGNVCATGALEDLRHQPSSFRRIAVIGDNELEIQFRHPQQHGQGPGIIDVAANVRVENNGNGLCMRRGAVQAEAESGKKDEPETPVELIHRNFAFLVKSATGEPVRVVLRHQLSSQCHDVLTVWSEPA